MASKIRKRNGVSVVGFRLSVFGCQVVEFERAVAVSNLYRDRVGMKDYEIVLDTFFLFVTLREKTLELTMVVLLSGRVNLREATAELKFVSRPGWRFRRRKPFSIYFDPSTSSGQASSAQRIILFILKKGFGLTKSNCTEV